MRRRDAGKDAAGLSVALLRHSLRACLVDADLPRGCVDAGYFGVRDQELATLLCRRVPGGVVDFEDFILRGETMVRPVLVVGVVESR